MTRTLRTSWPRLVLGLLLFAIACALPAAAGAQQENRLRRIAVHPHQGFTRVDLFFLAPPDYTLRSAPGRVRIEVRGADAPLFKKLRAYSDPQLSGLFISSRQGKVFLSIAVKGGEPGVQAISCANPAVLSIDIGPAVKRGSRVDIAPDREPILSGTQAFVREYEPEPAGLPFAPTDAKLLKEMFPEVDAITFQHGESLLYREQGEEAAAVFSSLLDRPGAPRALVSYRLGEAFLGCGRTAEALAAFREGETLWPQYLEQAPALLQSYAAALAQSGDYRGGRALLLKLMDRFAGTPYQAELMIRLADMTARHGDAGAAIALYRSVVMHAPGTPAAARARLKIADRELFTISRDRYRELLAKYQAVYLEPGNFALRDEALFKMTLLLGLYAPAGEALETAISYDRRYPRGIFGTIVKKMREELLLPVYRDMARAGKEEALAQLALDNREYLSRCFSDPAFAERVSLAFQRTGTLTREMELFGYLDQKNWAAAAAPFMLSRVVDDAAALGKTEQAQALGRNFLSRFPSHALGGRVREQLGRIAYESGDLKGAAAELSFLHGRGVKPQFPDSDYYLGKALEAAGDHRGTVRSMSRFTSNAPDGAPLLPDGYFTLALALTALGDNSRALAACEVGATVAAGEMAGQFLYKKGEILLQTGGVAEAKAAWEKAAALGGTWGKLAGEGLTDLAWRMKIGKELP